MSLSSFVDELKKEGHAKEKIMAEKLCERCWK